jgi:hypothetical protein
VGRITWNDVIIRLLTAWVRVNFSTFNFGINHPLGDILRSGTHYQLIKHPFPKIPHIKLECVDLCGLGGVGGMIAPIQFQIFKENGTLLDKPPFLALKRCVKNIIIFISRYTRNFSLFWDYNAYSTIRNMPYFLTSWNKPRLLCMGCTYYTANCRPSS